MQEALYLLFGGFLQPDVVSSSKRFTTIHYHKQHYVASYLEQLLELSCM